MVEWFTNYYIRNFKLIKRALLSVWDKDGIIELGEFLLDNNIEIFSTGGTLKILQKAGLIVKSVSEITGLDSVMDGRVKTLDPKIFGGILADFNNRKHIKDLSSIGGLKFDLVVVNFYPFVKEAVEKKLDFSKAIEYIDIGGPSMIRAAAKNYHSVIPLCSPLLYSQFKDQFQKYNGNFSIEIRQKYAQRVFAMTAQYESSIYDYFSSDKEKFPDQININVSRVHNLRYGENPHQRAAFYLTQEKELPWKQYQGKELSYNNYSDIESAIDIVLEFNRKACAIVKHANPCGFGLGSSIFEAYKRAVSTDPVSYFGGIVAFNYEIDDKTAKELVKPFLECVIAPSISEEAMQIFRLKKNLRVLTVKNDYNSASRLIKSSAGGYLIQQKDSDQGELDSLEIVTDLKPNKKQYKAIKLGWRLVRFVKSNAIVYSNENQLLGIGAGQMSRIDSVKIGIRKVTEVGLNLMGSVLASDAFFPFKDSIELAAKSGVKVIVQPGGSIKDNEVIECANKLGIVMAFTKTRHFYH